MRAVVPHPLICRTDVSAAFVTATALVPEGEVEPGFTLLCVGKTFDGWKPAEVNKDSWKIEEGTFAFQAHDLRSVVGYENIRVKPLD